MIQPIHTTVKGRARYKVNGLYHSEALKKYLELKLLQEKIIEQVRANPLTGNILIIFCPNISQDFIASLLEKAILDYRKTITNFIQPSFNQSAVIIGNENIYKLNHGNNRNLTNSHLFPIRIQKQSNLARNSLTPITEISALIFCTAILYKFGLDERILFGIQKLHSPFLHSLIVGITFFGEPAVLLLACLGFRYWLLRSHRSQEANILCIAATGAIGLNCLLKVLFARTRPELWDRIIHVGHHSFPSGHAMVSIVVYGYIGYIFAKQFPQYEKQISTFMIALITAIGFSRLYLGVHWLTDVTAGYAAGLIWLIFCISKLESQQKYNKKSFANINQLDLSQIRLQFLQ
jgi:membrane-associated phospholipid phosphatase